MGLRDALDAENTVSGRRQARLTGAACKALSVPLSLALMAGCVPASAFALAAAGSDNLQAGVIAEQGDGLEAIENGYSSLYQVYLPVLFRATNGLGEFAESYQAADTSQWDPEYFLFDLGCDGIPELMVRTSSFSGAGLVHVFSAESGEAVQVGSYWEWFGGSAGNSAGELFVAGWNQGSSYVNSITREGGKIVSTFLKSGKATTSNPSGEIQVVNEFLATHRASWLESSSATNYSLLDRKARYSLSKGTLTVAAAGAYTGLAKTPQVTVKFRGSTLQAGVDYSVSYANNVNAGLASVTVTGMGDYIGALSSPFTIMRANVSKVSVLLAQAGVYSGAEKKPAATVQFGSALLKQGVDYAIAYNNNVNAGTATAIITGQGNYQGVKTVNFPIAKAHLSNASISVESAGSYTGLAKTPGVKVQSGKKQLVQDIDYKLTYKNNKNAGTATVVVEGRGNYQGSQAEFFTIEKADISKATATLGLAGSFTGLPKTPTATAKYLNSFLRAGTDFTVSYKNNVKAGTATAMLVGRGNFQGVKSVGFSIAKADISRAAVSLASAGSYTGKAKMPAATVRLGSEALRKGADYSVSYKHNVNAGTGTATITGKGNYQGSKSLCFAIGKADISHAGVSIAAAGSYTGAAKKPAVKVAIGGKALAHGSDFTLAYKNNKDAGKATVTIEGKGNYKGSRSAEFPIAKAGNPMVVKTAGKVLKASLLQQKAHTVTAVSFAKKPQGNVTYKNASSAAVSKVISVNKETGAITVKKRTGKGSYPVRLIVTAAGGKNYQPLSKTVTVNVVVK